MVMRLGLGLMVKVFEIENARNRVALIHATRGIAIDREDR